MPTQRVKTGSFARASWWNCGVIGVHLYSARMLALPRLARSGRLDILHAVQPLRRYVDGGPTSGSVSSFEEETPEKPELKCDACGEVIEGIPAGSGLFLWTRGDEVRFEEPPLCESCAYAIAVGGTLAMEIDEEG